MPSIKGVYLFSRLCKPKDTQGSFGTSNQPGFKAEAGSWQQLPISKQEADSLSMDKTGTANVQNLHPSH